MPKQNVFTIYTDGGCKMNPGGAGGAAAVIIHNKKITEISKGFTASTNNRMEIMAIILGMRNLPKRKRRIHVDLYSDSQYALNCLMGQWERRNNKDLWFQLDACVPANVDIEAHWVQGHTGIKENERCDELCTQAMQHPTEPDTGYTPEPKLATTSSKNQQSGIINSMKTDIVIPPEYKEDHGLILSPSEMCARYHIKPSCAEGICTFQNSRKNFKAYMKMKTGGLDHWSNKSILAIVQNNTQKELILQILRNNISNPVKRTCAARWYARGLSLKDAIRKVFVDMEISQNALKRKYA